MKEYHVYLDQRRLPLNDEALTYAETIANALLNICKLIRIWDEPRYGRRIYTTKEIPQDVPQAGIYWIEVELPEIKLKKGENGGFYPQFIRPNLKNSHFFN